MESTLQTHRFSFTGTTAEYFKIWFVNIALTILTFGIYGPWAKVRRERYLLNHTFLGSVSFDYTADPIKILKGRIIMFVAFAIFSLIQNFIPIAAWLIFILFIPHVINRALKFRAHYTTYRNISFRFSGTPLQTFLKSILIPFLAAIPLGLLYPWGKKIERSYFLENLSYGGIKFKLNAPGGSFYMAYLIPTLGIIFISLLTSLGIFLVMYLMQGQVTQVQATALGTFIFIFLIIALPTLVRSYIAVATWNGATFNGFTVNLSVRSSELCYLLMTNILITVITLGLGHPFCIIRARNYFVDRISLVGTTSLEHFQAEREEAIRALGDQAAEIFDVDADFGV